jgi:hypothetical protein
MKLAICTIQRNRGLWLKEWVAFHYLVGFRKFYIYLHRCTDNSADVVKELIRRFDIDCFVIPDETITPQLACYGHAYREFGHKNDWIAFIDGDEFLYPVESEKIEEVLMEYDYEKISAIGVWWACFGSNYHVDEPNGLMVENYVRRPPLNFIKNSHIKSIVRGRQGNHCTPGNNSHLFNTIEGTYDEGYRKITRGFMPDLTPTHNKLRVNHYVCQSLNYFKNFKQKSGAADAGSQMVRSDEWWGEHNRNDEYDDQVLRFLPNLLNLIND